MKKTANNIIKWRKYYASVCKQHEGGYKSQPLSCHCETAAQIANYIDCVIPDDYQRFEIDDFDGMVNGQRIISEDTVYEAKKQLVSYCWEGLDPDEIGNYDFKCWWSKSSMEKRRRNGNSIVIYGNPWSSAIKSGRIQTFKKPLGRTMLAAIVMKEAIRMRLRSGHSSDTYAWVSYNRLYDKLMQRAKDRDEYNAELLDYETADWLCVDGFEIEKQNEATRSFKAKVLDSFFDERFSNGLPNILVFQDDLSQDYDLRQEFGMSVSSIITSSRTTRVKMIEKD